MAKKEGVYVKRIEHPGVDTIQEAVALAYMCIRDLRRGYTYDASNNCRKIKMTSELFEKRVNYIYTLAKKHGASKKELKIIKELVDFVIKYKKLPKRVARKSTKAILKRMIVRR